MVDKDMVLIVTYLLGILHYGMWLVGSSALCVVSGDPIVYIHRYSILVITHNTDNVASYTPVLYIYDAIFSTVFL